MKKIVISLAALAIATTSIIPSFASLDNSNSSKIPNYNSQYCSYQNVASFLDYLNSNTALQQLLISDASFGLNGYKYVNSTINLLATPDLNSGSSSIKGTLLMNGSIQTSGQSPNIVNQHIVDNSNGLNPITINYDSNTITETASVSVTISQDIKKTVTKNAGIDLFFFSAGVKTEMTVDVNKSKTASVTKQENLTFDKFSTTVPKGKKEEIDYVVINDINKFNMVLKTEMDLNKSTFNFSNGVSTKSISWEQIINNKNLEYTFGLYLDQLNVHTGFDKGFLSVPKMLNPDNPSSSILNLEHVYAFVPLSFSVSGFTSLITEKELK